MELRLFTLLCIIPVSLGYRHYADRIPNGDHVLHPCKDFYIWHGVGHLHTLGGGSLNVFGVDFAAANHSWTETLCKKDSDNDGRSNGEELGDPNCTWKEGTLPQRITDITHPAICQPMESDSCRNKAVPNDRFSTQEEWMEEACKAAEFECDALKNTDDVRVMNMRIPTTPVPAQETIYMCVSAEFENLTGDFHLIATTPIINNSYVIHHMTLFGCEDDMPIREPYECGRKPCADRIATWGLGATGVCFPPMTGVRLGKTGYKHLLIQFHWNNPTKRADFIDSSGLALYYTPKLRVHDSIMMQVGPEYFQIPPFTENTITSSDCSSTCTRNILHGDIYVTIASNHMHYLGTRQSLELYRNNQLVTYITNETDFRYDNPKVYYFDNPINIKPGDMLRTTCHFSSHYKSKTTFFGLGTFDEMCFSYMMVYPAQNVNPTICGSWKSLLTCDNDTEKGCIEEERIKFSKNFNQTQFYSDITSVCKPFGPCIKECKEAILQAKSREPCFKNEDSWEQIKWTVLSQNENGRNFLAGLESCQLEVYLENRLNDDTSILKTTEKPSLKSAVVDDSGEGVKIQANLSTLLAAILFGILLSARVW